MLMKKVWIQIRWLHKKPADLDVHHFQKRVYNFESYAHRALIRLNTVATELRVSKSGGRMQDHAFKCMSE